MRAGRFVGAFGRSQKASVSMLTALGLTMMVGFAGAAVDFGSVYMQTRQLQGVADLAAMAAAGNLPEAQQAANATVQQNGMPAGTTATAVTGVYDPNSDLPPDQRFTPGATPANAVKVTLNSPASLYFTKMFLGKQSIPLARTAVAASGQLASFSIGTRLAGLQGGIENALLTGLTGSSVSLSVMDYNSLVGAQIDLFQYVNALATRMQLTGVSFDRTLSAQVSSNLAILAVGDVLKAQGNNSAATAINTVAAAANTPSVSLGQLLNLGPYQDQDYIQANGPSGFSVNALDLANAVLLLAQGGRQVQLNLSASLPGIAGATAWLAIGQRPVSSPWLSITDSNSEIVRTAQSRLYLDVQVASGLTGVASINVPIYLELASAEGKLSSIGCEPTSTEQVALSVAPSIGETAIGSINTSQLNDFSQELTISPATMINVASLLQVTGNSLIQVGGGDWQNVSFNQTDIQDQTVKTVKTTNAVDETLTSLVSNLSLNVQLLGLGLGLNKSAVQSAVVNSINSAAPTVDNAVNGLTSLLGVGLGEADVWVNGVRCQNVALVQ